MKRKVFERKRKGKTRLRRVSEREPSFSRSPVKDHRAELSAGLDALRRGSSQALTAETVRALQRHMGNGALQRLAREEGFVGDPSLEADLEREQGGGRPLSSPVRGEMEGAFGADLSGVRVHTDGKADELSRGLGAHAFAHGRDIYFADGEYAPATTSGQHLLAHELAHVVQQGAGAKLIVGGAHDPAEKEADRAANEVVRAIRAGETGVGRQSAEHEDFAWSLRRQVDDVEEGDIVMNAVSREDLVVHLVAFGRSQLDSLPARWAAGDARFYMDLSEKTAGALNLSSEMLGAWESTVQWFIRRRRDVFLLDCAGWHDSLQDAAEAFAFAGDVGEQDLSSDRYGELEKRFWLEYGAYAGVPDTVDVEGWAYNRLCDSWNEFVWSRITGAVSQILSMATQSAAGGEGGE